MKYDILLSTSDVEGQFEEIVPILSVTKDELSTLIDICLPRGITLTIGLNGGHDGGI